MREGVRRVRWKRKAIELEEELEGCWIDKDTSRRVTTGVALRMLLLLLCGELVVFLALALNPSDKGSERLRLKGFERACAVEEG